jgi:hypothetical protein
MLCFVVCSILRVSNVGNAAVFSDAVNLENSLKNISSCIKFLAHLANGNVSFCHHLASVVR